MDGGVRLVLRLYRNEVTEVITQMIAYCGFPAATNALMAARKVFGEAERDGKSPPGSTTGSVQENQ